MNKTKIILWIIITVIIIGGLWYGQGRKEKEKIKIGGIFSLSGSPYANDGIAMLEGAKIAINEINEKGGIIGRPVKFIVDDDQTNWGATDVTIANKFLDIDKVDVVLTMFYEQAATFSSTIGRAGKPLFLIWDSNEEIANLGDFIFSGGLWNPSTGIVLADFAYKKLNIKNIAVLYEQDVWSLLVTKSFRDEFRKLGGTISKEFITNPEEKDFKTIITLIKNLGVDAVVNFKVNNVDLSFIQLKKLDYKGAVLAGDPLMFKEIRDTAQGSTEGAYVTGPYVDPQNREFLYLKEAYERNYKKPLEREISVALGYDTIKIIAESLKYGLDLNTIRNTARSINKLSGATGEISFNGNNFAIRPEVIYRIENNIPKFISF